MRGGCELLDVALAMCLASIAVLKARGETAGAGHSLGPWCVAVAALDGEEGLLRLGFRLDRRGRGEVDAL